MMNVRAGTGLMLILACWFGGAGCDSKVTGIEKCVAGTIDVCQQDEGCAVTARLCLDDGTWTPCSAVDSEFEACNGVDDDCDGKVDEDNPEGGHDCPTGELGECAVGVTQCLEPESGLGTAHSLECLPVGLPQEELCDGLDNDCDGEADEGMPADGPACATGLPGECAVGRASCQGETMECVAVTQPIEEVCNGLDDDCDGTVDEELSAVGTDCDVEGQLGVCGAGVISCVEGSLECLGDAPSEEVCDGLDNDCNGTPDDPALIFDRGRVEAERLIKLQVLTPLVVGDRVLIGWQADSNPGPRLRKWFVRWLRLADLSPISDPILIRERSGDSGEFMPQARLLEYDGVAYIVDGIYPRSVKMWRVGEDDATVVIDEACERWALPSHTSATFLGAVSDSRGITLAIRRASDGQPAEIVFVRSTGGAELREVAVATIPTINLQAIRLTQVGSEIAMSWYSHEGGIQVLRLRADDTVGEDLMAVSQEEGSSGFQLAHHVHGDETGLFFLDHREVAIRRDGYFSLHRLDIATGETTVTNPRVFPRNRRVEGQLVWHDGKLRLVHTVDEYVEGQRHMSDRCCDPVIVVSTLDESGVAQSSTTIRTLPSHDLEHANLRPKVASVISAGDRMMLVYSTYQPDGESAALDLQFAQVGLGCQ